VLPFPIESGKAPRRPHARSSLLGLLSTSDDHSDVKKSFLARSNRQIGELCTSEWSRRRRQTETTGLREPHLLLSRWFVLVAALLGPQRLVAVEQLAPDQTRDAAGCSPMPELRGLAMLVVAAAAGSAVLVGPTYGSAAERRAPTVHCSGYLGGVDAHGRLHWRYLDSSSVTNEVVSDPLPFSVTNIGLVHRDVFDFKSVLHMRATSEKGRPRAVTGTMSDADGSPSTLSVESTPIDNWGFTPRLFTSARSEDQAPHVASKVFAVRGPRLVRFTTVHDTYPSSHFDDRVVLRRHMKTVKTLAYYNRLKVNGRTSDILFATTRKGSLLEIRVPVGAPHKVSVVTVKRSGFARCTGLAVPYPEWGSCWNGIGIAGVSAKDNLARWYSLTHVRDPKAKGRDQGSADRQRLGLAAARDLLRAPVEPYCDARRVEDCFVSS
jgi:hypothetical protein